MPSAADRLLLGVARRAPRWTAALLAVMAAADVLAPLAAAGYEASSTAWLRRRLLDRALALGVGGPRRLDPGDLLSRVGADAPATAQVLPDLLQAAVAVLTGAGAVVVLALLEELSATGRRLWQVQRRIAWGVGLLVPLEETVVLAVAGLGLAAGRLTPGDLLAAVGYTRLALGLFEQVDVLVAAARARAGAARAADALDDPAAPAQARPAPPMALPAGG